MIKQCFIDRLHEKTWVFSGSSLKNFPDFCSQIELDDEKRNRTLISCCLTLLSNLLVNCIERTQVRPNAIEICLRHHFPSVSLSAWRQDDFSIVLFVLVYRKWDFHYRFFSFPFLLRKKCFLCDVIQRFWRCLIRKYSSSRDIL